MAISLALAVECGASQAVAETVADLLAHEVGTQFDREQGNQNGREAWWATGYLRGSESPAARSLYVRK